MIQKKKLTDLDRAFPTDNRPPHQFLPPEGILAASFDEAHGAGCLQAETESLELMFNGLLVSTEGNPCDGCPIWDRQGPKCRCFQKYHTAFKDFLEQQHLRLLQLEEKKTPHNVSPGHPLAGLSVKQIAAKLNLSISEVRRRKMAGTLEFTLPPE